MQRDGGSWKCQQHVATAVMDAARKLICCHPTASSMMQLRFAPANMSLPELHLCAGLCQTAGCIAALFQTAAATGQKARQYIHNNSTAWPSSGLASWLTNVLQQGLAMFTIFLGSWARSLPVAHASNWHSSSPVAMGPTTAFVHVSSTFVALLLCSKQAICK